MHRALDSLTVRPQHIIVDGNKFKAYSDPATGIGVAHHTVVKGDGKYMSIAAASVLAKTHRDELMARYAARYPGYGWERNAGYPTKEHKEAISRLGLTPIHRLTFRGCKEKA